MSEEKEKYTQFWPFWVMRVFWLFTLLAVLWWWLNDNQLGGWSQDTCLSLDWAVQQSCQVNNFVLIIVVALVLQAIFFVEGLLERLPSLHDLFSTVVAALLTVLMFLLFPEEQRVMPLLLGLVPLFDLARRRGWAALFLLQIFPLLPLGLNYLETGSLAEADSYLWSIWGLAALLGCGISRAPIGPVKIIKVAEEKQNGPSPENIVAEIAQLLARETNYRQITEKLVSGGAKIIDSGSSQKSRTKAIAFTFKRGLSDVLEVPAVHNLQSHYVDRTFELSGILGTLLREGDPIETDSSHSPFNEIKALKEHRLLLFPLRTSLDLYGAVMFATQDDERAEDEEVQRTLIALADQASLSLHNAVLQQKIWQNEQEKLKEQEKARHQLARDLHDGPIQRVAAMSMQVEFIKQLVKRERLEEAQDELTQVQSVAKQAAHQMRTMLFALRPIVLEEEGLVAALETFVKRMSQEEKLKISFKADKLPRLEDQTEEVTFAIMQEAIGNAKKHSDGAPIHVRIIKQNSTVIGEVKDEGPGFDLEAVMSNYSSRASLGLLNMQERAAMVGGELKIETAPGKGTTVSIAVPLNRA